MKKDACADFILRYLNEEEARERPCLCKGRITNQWIIMEIISEDIQEETPETEETEEIETLV